jgi:hypothetical protein
VANFPQSWERWYPLDTLLLNSLSYHGDLYLRLEVEMISDREAVRWLRRLILLNFWVFYATSFVQHFGKAK